MIRRDALGIHAGGIVRDGVEILGDDIAVATLEIATDPELEKAARAVIARIALEGRKALKRNKWSTDTKKKTIFGN